MRPVESRDPRLAGQTLKCGCPKLELADYSRPAVRRRLCTWCSAWMGMLFGLARDYARGAGIRTWLTYPCPDPVARKCPTCGAEAGDPSCYTAGITGPRNAFPRGDLHPARCRERAGRAVSFRDEVHFASTVDLLSVWDMDLAILDAASGDPRVLHDLEVAWPAFLASQRRRAEAGSRLRRAIAPRKRGGRLDTEVAARLHAKDIRDATLAKNVTRSLPARPGTLRTDRPAPRAPRMWRTP